MKKLLFISITILAFAMNIDAQNPSEDLGNAYIDSLRLVDYRWNEVFYIDDDFGKRVIENDEITQLYVDYDLIPFGSTLPSTYTCATNKVMRREVIVNNDNNFSVNSGVKLDMYGTDDYDCKLLIGEKGNLIIGDNAIITAKRGICEIEINGDVTIGKNVTFAAENNAIFKIKILSGTDVDIDSCRFNNVSLEIDATKANNSIAMSNHANITNCTFIGNKNNIEFALKLNNYSNYTIAYNEINGVGFDQARHINDAILVYYSGILNFGNISNNIISGCNYAGLTMYSSNSNITMNNITNCGYGVKLLNGSTINNFSGHCGALNNSATQYIHDNDISEIYIHKGSMPQTFRYNLITNSKDGALVTYEHINDNTDAINYILDLEYNNWGSLTNTQIENKFVTITNNNNNIVTYDYLPKWSMGSCQNYEVDAAQQMSLEADSLWSVGNYDLAEYQYKSIISNYPNSNSAENSLKKLLILENDNENDYESLQEYYKSDSVINDNEVLTYMADYLANKCDENLQNYNEAIKWYEARIIDETTSYNDSIFATIDLGNLYLKMDDNRIKGIQGKLTQFIPKSREDHSLRTDYALRLLDNNSNKNTKYHELTGYYWTDHVTEQPEGFDIDDNGNVSISTREGLVWLVSTVNGLNGQEPNDYEGLVVTLNDDLYDLNYYTWVPIGTSDNPFRGTFDGQNFIIDDIYMEDSEEGTNFGLFGTLDSAVIKRITLGDRCIIYSYENSGGIAYLADNNTIIDECYVSVQMSVNNTSGGIVCINRDSKISNCCFNPYRYEIDGSYNGGIAGQNISVNSDAIIENSYVVTPFLEDEYYSHTAGIVGKNITESNNHKAIIRNCYAVPLYLQGEGCSGITSYNSENSIIENCYTNRDFDICKENYGKIINCTVFDEDLQFDKIIEVFDVSASELTTALNLWTNHNSYNGRYLSWKYISDAMNYGYPILYPPLPEDYWTDLVTEQPEGYVVDENGDVHIYSAEALAWVSVLGNGLHGTEITNFEGVTITLENDIDLSAAKWSPIGGMSTSYYNSFNGTFNGNNKIINTLILTGQPNNANQYNGFFKILRNAKVQNLIIKDSYFLGNIMDGGLLAAKCENSTIEYCYVESSYYILGGKMSTFINDMESSVIHDCILVSPIIDNGGDQSRNNGLFVGCKNGDSHIYNCAAIVRDMHYSEFGGFVGSHNEGTIENCYVYINKYVGYMGWAGGPGPRNGIVWVNRAQGKIINSFYNVDIMTDYGIIVFDLDNLPTSINEGVIENTCSFAYENEYWQLSESIVINNNSTDDLVEALNLGVEKLEAEGHECLDWKMTPVGQLGNLVLPVLDFDSYLSTSETIISDNKIAIYPNPAQSHINIEAENIDQVEIYNTMGQMLDRIDVNADDVEIDVSKYQSGIYLIKTIAKDGISVNKVVKM